MRTRGFTLIELAIVLTIIGLLLSTFTAFWKVYQKQRERDINNAAIAQVTAAINKFYAQNNYFPCPSGPFLGIGDPMRGVESRYGAPVPPDTSIAGLGRCQSGPSAGSGAPEDDATTGIKRLAGWRVDPTTKTEPNTIVTQSYPGPAESVTVDDTSTYVGAVPYVTLGLPEKYTYDAYGMKLTYAVSNTATHLDTYDPIKSNMTVQRFFFGHAGPGDPVKTIPDDNNSVTYLVFSGGRDKLGVYNRNGVIENACPAVVQSDGTFPERENCDNDAIFLQTLTTNSDLGLNVDQPAYHFDDIIASQQGANAALWENVPGSVNDDIRSVNLGNVGVGMDPHSKIRLDVSGNARADKLIANYVCGPTVVNGATIEPPNNGHCFNPNALTSGNLKCPAGTVLSAIGFGNPLSTPEGLKYNCSTPTIYTMGIVGVCDPGKFVIGFNSDGSVCCTGETCT